MKTLLLSDVHLDVGPESRERMAEFAALLRTFPGKGVGRLIILGDLFDFWFEYRHVIFSGYFDVLQALAELRDRGIELHLVCGNHDFWAGRFLRDHLNFAIYQESVEMDFGGRRALLIHGDGINPQDWRYRLYKRFARARLIIGLFRRLHPDRAMNIARWVSRKSSQRSWVADPAKGAEAAALRAYAQGVIARGQADIVVCGHAHAPAIEECPALSGTGLYVNTGDWMYHRTYVEWNGEDFGLHKA